MKRLSYKKGSALLIVLGMLTFLIVSAVGFSAYMRTSRLPSSFLRRTTSSRQLVKAAMAEAIDTLDKAINDNPHPGIGSDSSTGENKNIWHGRVYTGTNSVDYATMVHHTVSPLCLEALAYIPPPLVNEARYYSRLTPTARWHTFAFDAGRYAYCILDVSDYFDINKMFAGKPRSSAANSRISLSYLFEQGRMHTSSGEGSEEWDTFMENFRTIDEETGVLDFEDKYPLISLADFNLALGNQSIAGIESPFCKYLNNNGNGDFYNVDGEEAEDKIRRLTFVTDSYYTGSSKKLNKESKDNNDVLYNLSTQDGQPFAFEKLQTAEGQRPLLTDTIVGGDSKNAEYWRKLLSGCGLGALFDYLDTDHVPCSLAIPTVERSPMICAINTMVPGAKFLIKREEREESNIAVDENTRQITVSVCYNINGGALVEGFAAAQMQALTVFPFLRDDEASSRQFTIDGQLSLFLASKAPYLRMNDDCFRIAKKPDDVRWIKDKGLLNAYIRPTQVKVKAKIQEQKDAITKVDKLDLSNVKAFGPMLTQNGNELLKVTYTWLQKKIKKDEFSPPDWSPTFAEVAKDPSKAQTILTTSAFKILDPDNIKNPYDVTSLGAKIKANGNGEGLKNISLRAAVWLRLKEGSDVVDMVPACINDDESQNNVKDVQVLRSKISNFGAPYPIIPLSTGIEFDFTIDALEALSKEDAQKEIKFSPETMVVADPRYNYAPESWFSVQHQGMLNEQVWLDNCNVGAGNKDDARNSDIFMSVSDAGYLQSISELAFLPRVTRLGQYNDSFVGDLPMLDGESRTEIPDNFNKTWSKDFVWKTYDQFGVDFKTFEELPFYHTEEGFKVNPFSDSTNIVMAAFANTPIDWRHCSTNELDKSNKWVKKLTAAEFNKKYAFNAYSENETAKIEWADLEAIAGKFMAQVRANNSIDWAKALSDLDWKSSNETKLFDINLGNNVKLWDVDRKYLYGYWKECFAAKQQLFLVFVRAEPMMMGSGFNGKAPPQLGGKAVALVWRDPRPQGGENMPHKTRVLFYRQFD